MYAKWKSDKKVEYVANLECQSVQLDQLAAILVDNTQVDVLEECIIKFSDVVTEAGSAHINRIRVGQPEGGKGGRGGKGRGTERGVDGGPKTNRGMMTRAEDSGTFLERHKVDIVK